MDAEVPSQVTTTLDAVAAANAVVKPDDEQNQKVIKCVELATRKDWQGLMNCARELEALGVKDRASEFKAKALKEQDNELKASNVRQALHDGNLKAAESLLAKIGDGSVYYKSLFDEFSKAETPAIEDAKRKAQAYAAHDCAGLKRYKQQVVASTERVFATVQAVNCGDKPSAADATTVTPPSSLKNSCDTMDVDDVVKQAQNQYANGFAGAALQIMSKALACRQDVKMYRLAAIYACSARDAASAKLYYAKVPPQFQAPIEQKCQQENTPLR